jgi:hypothetical protein
MVEGATAKDITLQKILYSCFPNQCWKCRWFGHFAQTCTMTRIPIWSGSAPTNTPPTWSERVARGPTDTSPPTPTETEGDKGAGASNHKGKSDQLPKRKGIKQDRVHPPKPKKTRKWGSYQPPQFTK